MEQKREGEEETKKYTDTHTHSWWMMWPYIVTACLVQTLFKALLRTFGNPLSRSFHSFGRCTHTHIHTHRDIYLIFVCISYDFQTANRQNNQLESNRINRCGQLVKLVITGNPFGRVVPSRKARWRRDIFLFSADDVRSISIWIVIWVLHPPRPSDNEVYC